MSFDINFFRKISGSYGTTNIVQQNIINLSKQISNQYNNTVNGFNALVESVRGTNCDINKPLYKYLNIDEKAMHTKILIDYNRNIVKTDVSPFVREIQSYFNVLHTGDYISYKNTSTKNEDVFLIDTALINELHNDKSYMELCNNSISWIDDKGYLYKLPCVIKTDTSMNDLNVSEITTLNRLRKIIIPNNELTSNFKVDMEFIFDHKDKFKISSIDRNTIAGVLNIILIDAEINGEVDNLDLNIANYEKLKNNYNLNILTGNNNNSLSIINNTQQILNIELKNNNKIIDLSLPENKYILQQIKCLSDDENIISIENNSNDIILTSNKIGSCNIEISINNIEDIEETKIMSSCVVNVIEENTVDIYTIEVSDENDDFTVRPSLENTFTAILKKNGIVIESSFIFSVKNRDSSQSILLGNIINTTNNSCSIECNKYKKYGILILTISDISGLITKEVEIQVKSLSDL